MGSKGKGKGRVDQNFQKQASKLAEQAGNIQKAPDGSEQRLWQIPDPKGWDTDPLNIAGMCKPFDRQEVGSNYEEITKSSGDPGTFGDLIGVAFQSDYLAAMERAFRARHHTHVRCLLISSGRRQGHADGDGAFLGSAINYAQDNIRDGQS